RESGRVQRVVSLLGRYCAITLFGQLIRRAILSMYNLTPTQQALLRSIVEKVRTKQMPEEFTFMWGPDGAYLHYKGAQGFYPAPDVTQGALDTLAAIDLLHIRTEPGDKFGRRYCTLTGKAYEAV